jgi:uncharacterized protein YprB with RNaseH-like and TPR domain
MRDLTARLREIVRQDARARPPAGSSADRVPARELTYVADPDTSVPSPEARLAALGADACGSGGTCAVIDRLYPADRSYGRRPIEWWAPAAGRPLHLFDRRIGADDDWARRVVFFDIETTGLSGGAGMLAFLAGCGWFEERGFRVRQFFLIGPAGERAMLDALAGLFAGASLVVTYNGRTFDLPFMEMRWAFHRLECPTGTVPHVDMLPAARRLWRRREVTADELSCSLLALERDVLGVRRILDVPSFEIPARYFHFLRTGDTTAVEPVLEHNRSDIVSLAAVMAHALWMAHEGPDACREPAEQLALGRVYARGGLTALARDAYERAASGDDGDVRREALAELAAAYRREARHDEAARAWEEILRIRPAREDRGARIERRAFEALAIHHEHRRKDLAEARRYAEALSREAAGRLRREVDHRMRRLDAKLERAQRRMWED